MVSSNAIPMNYPNIPYRIFPLGDSAITVDFGNVIDEAVNNEVIGRFHQLKNYPLHGMIEMIPAYSSLTIRYDVCTVRKNTTIDITAFDWMKNKLDELLQLPMSAPQTSSRLLQIPVCYENGFAPDIKQLAAIKNLPVEEVIQVHTAREYKVYMLGFLPGFAYMGELDEKIAIPRKAQPQITFPGSVGIAGKQTGIYPLRSPGGWQIIGRTPLKLFDADREDPTLFQAGDIVQFYSITENNFYEIKNSLSFKKGDWSEV